MRAAFANFQHSLNKIRDITIDIDTAAPLALKHRTVLNRHETIQCAITVILAGFFESFLRDLAEAYVGGLCATYRPFSSLPQIVQQTHFRYGGAVLEKRAQSERSGNPHWVTASSSDIVRRLASVNANAPYELLWEAFADTRQNPEQSAS